MAQRQERAIEALGLCCLLLKTGCDGGGYVLMLGISTSVPPITLGLSSDSGFGSKVSFLAATSVSGAG
jgi:hypothetical protein